MRSRSMLATAVLVATGGVGSAVALAADATVTFECCDYAPKQVNIGVGESVTFQPGAGNDFEGSGSTSHPLAFEDASIPAQRSGSAPVSRRFDQAGTFAYYCEVHGAKGGAGMAGSVVVGGGTTTTTTPTTTAPPTTTTPAQQPTPSSPSGPSSTSPAVSILAVSAPRTIRATTLRARGLRVVVDAARGPATFTARLRANGQTLAQGRAVAAPGQRTTIRLRLTARGRRSVARRARTRAVVAVSSSSGAVATMNRRITIVR